MTRTAASGEVARTLTESLPYWPVSPTLTSSLAVGFEFDVVRALWVVLPSAILWGASFPLALAAVTTRGQDAGRIVGRVYAANTVGAQLVKAQPGQGACFYFTLMGVTTAPRAA